MISIQIFRRFAMSLFLAVAVVGCSSSGPAERSGVSSASPIRNDDCRWNRGSCMHEGSYDAGERDYAEQEARRLNQAAIQRLRRGAWR